MTSPSWLTPGAYFHIYNRGTNGENIFVEKRNYAYFLQLYAKAINKAYAARAACSNILSDEFRCSHRPT
jgi:REP-associated tyrosine transposase